MNDIKPDEFEEVYKSPVINKLLDSYYSMDQKKDYYECLVNFLASNKNIAYSYANTIASAALHRQGKNRKRFDPIAYRLSKNYEGKMNISDDLDEVFLEIIQQFMIITNSDLRNAEENNNQAGIKFAKSCVKTLMVLIFNANLYWVLSQIELPRYVTNGVNNLLAVISQGRTNIFNEYLESLVELGYPQLVDTVNMIGMDKFFERSTKSISMFNRFFEKELNETGTINSEEYKKLLSNYEDYKNLYHSMYDELKIKDIIPYFNSSDNAYSKGIYDSRKPYVINKLNDIAENLGNASVINKLIYNENK